MRVGPDLALDEPPARRGGRCRRPREMPRNTRGSRRRLAPCGGLASALEALVGVAPAEPEQAVIDSANTLNRLSSGSGRVVCALPQGSKYARCGNRIRALLGEPAVESFPWSGRSPPASFNRSDTGGLPMALPDYRLQPPCAGRLVLTRWAALALVFPLVWLAAQLKALACWIALRSFDRTPAAPHRDTLLSRLHIAHRHSLRWLRKSSGWDVESHTHISESSTTPSKRIDQ